MLLESLLLALLGGSLGLLVAWAGVSWLAHVGSVDLPRLNDVRIDGRALLFVILASVATAALSGTVPAWLVSRASLSQTLAAAGKSLTESRTTRRTHAMLVAFQVSVCTLLLVIAGLLGRSLLHLLHLDPGFSVEHVLTADVDLPVAAYEKPATRDGFYSRVLEGIRRLPGVRSAAWISILPLEGEGSVSGINLPGEILPPDQEPIANYRPVSPDYFATLGIPLVSGRAFTERDRGTRGIVVSQALAHRLWPNQEPVGQHCIAKWGALQLEPSEVIGVAGDIHNRLGKPPLNVVYVSDAWSKAPPAAPDFASIVVRTDQDPATMASAVRTVIHREGPGVPILALRPMSEVVSLQLEGRRFQLSLTACFAISALLLVALGVFGVLAYSVERRQREFGIRTAFGAQHHDLLALVMWQGLWPVTFGLACGIVAAVLSGSVLRSFLAGVTPFDPLTLAGVALLIAVVAALACYLPARRAISADPVVSLRCE
jgi:predicted permease